MAHDIFLSHSTKDKVTADAICAGLEANGVRCWVAPRDIRPGQNWGEAIVGGINGCKVMVIVFSSHSNQSDHVLREIERAVNNGSVLIPFRIEDVEPSTKMEYFLSVPHWLDAMTKPLGNHIAALTKTVKSIISSPVDSESVQDQPGPIPAATQVPFAKKQLVIGMVGLVLFLVIAFGIYALMKSVPDGASGEKDLTAKKTAQEQSQSEGSIRIETETVGVRYTIESETLSRVWKGETPATESGLPVGEYDVSVSDPDWPNTRKVEVKKDEVALAVFKRGSVKIETKPSGAIVFQSGKRLGTTPLELKNVKPGKTYYQLQLDGYYLSVLEMEVVGGSQVETHKKLEKGQGPKPERGEIFQASNGMVLVWLPDGYWVGQFEVTQEEFERVMGKNPSSSIGPRKPVETVSSLEAVTYCNKLTATDRQNGVLPKGYVYSLPNRAQWNYFKGNASKDKVVSSGIDKALANVKTEEDMVKLIASSKGQSSQPVGMLPPNSMGLYDVFGNVWEWEAGTSNIVYGSGWAAAFYDPISRLSEILGEAASPHGAIGFRCVAVKGNKAAKLD